MSSNDVYNTHAHVMSKTHATKAKLNNFMKSVDNFFDSSSTENIKKMKLAKRHSKEMSNSISSESVPLHVHTTTLQSQGEKSNVNDYLLNASVDNNNNNINNDNNNFYSNNNNKNSTAKKCCHKHHNHTHNSHTHVHEQDSTSDDLKCFVYFINGHNPEVISSGVFGQIEKAKAKAKQQQQSGKIFFDFFFSIFC